MTFTVGAGAAQTLVKVCPMDITVLHPWPVMEVVPPTHDQFDGQHWIAVVSVPRVVEKPRAFVRCSQAEVHPLGHIPGLL
jgi:hypothetical protein